jgi:hypothetical protein
MSLRRGFKTRANQISVRLRKGQGKSPESPIDLGVIAERLSIEIVPLSMLKGDCQAAVRRLSIADNGSFSAATLPIDSGQHIIVHNDSHDPRRQRGNLAHELAHLLLGHPFTYPIDPSGCRNVDRDIEDEASWLGPTILVSNEAALHIVRQGFDEDTACEMYGVSHPLLRMRINGSGARIRHSRSYY